MKKDTKARSHAGRVRAACVDLSRSALARALGLPADVGIVAIQYDPMMDCHSLILTGGQLPPTRVGEVLPRLKLTIKSPATTELHR